jgi:hypothetical protein
MASTIAAITTGIGGIVTTADATGNLSLLSGTSTVLALTATGVAVTGTLTASGVTTNAAGSAALPSITTTGDTDTGVWFPAANTLAASTAGTERMRIDSSGNVGIGTSSPSAFGGTNLQVQNSTVATVLWGNGTITGQLLCTSGAEVTVGARSNHSLRFCTNDTERMRIDTSGSLLVGTTSSILTTARLTVQTAGSAGIISATSSNTNLFCINTAAASWEPINFRYNTSTEVGKIECTSTATSYATSSDYRLKDNVTPMTGALATVALLKPCNYKWIADGSNGQGFIAHEIQAVVPDCVVGEKDAVDDEGKPKYQGIDTSFLVATLTAAIQEAHALIIQLQADVAALKGVKA